MSLRASKVSGCLFLLFLTIQGMGLGCATSAPVNLNDSIQTTPVSPTPEPQTKRMDPPKELLAPGYLIQLQSASDQKLNGSFQIQSDGIIQLPYSTKIQTLGLGLEQFQSQIETAYQPYFKGRPNVQALIKSRRYFVEVRGLVGKPGSYLIDPDAQLDQLISQAGGLTEDVSGGFAKIQNRLGIRWIDLEQYFKTGSTESPLVWVGGEEVFFQKERVGHSGFAGSPNDEALTIQILGEVKNPGEYSFKKNTDLFDFLIKSGGILTTANLDRIEIIRKQETKRHVLFKGNVHDSPALQEGDLILIPSQNPSRFEKAFQTISTVTSTLAGIISTVLLVMIAL